VSPIGHYGFTGPGFVGPTGTPFSATSFTSSGTAIAGAASTGSISGFETESGYHPRETYVAVKPEGHGPYWTPTIPEGDPIVAVTMTVVAFGCAACVVVSRWQTRDVGFVF